MFRLPSVRRPTPLIYAICCHQLNVVKLLVSLGADLKRSIYSWHPIHFAAAVRDVEILDFLLNSCPDEIEAVTDHQVLYLIFYATPLHFAVTANCVEMVILLLSRGANVNHANSDKETSLHMSMVLFDTQIAKILLAFGAKSESLNARKMTPLQVAQQRNNQVMIDFFNNVASNPKLIPSKEKILKQFPVTLSVNSDSATSSITAEPAADPEAIIEHLDILSQRLSAVEEAVGLTD
ncbi:ankyrin repeat protein [Tritrichomonas foetus]|uniref:Ankyrin repeat protein n=1 Tax=Tritrichomonas foetus TaxID=1144522 RepID=A0A1J4KSS9_9EUKA|nr:ankyrin repeat protein [Tritrichomonas foetus]|eukprot:OHT14162.1 ankyrin repeat protein [Tritrichomonas foetus]